jgi:hypothetical protein
MFSVLPSYHRQHQIRDGNASEPKIPDGVATNRLQFMIIEGARNLLAKRCQETKKALEGFVFGGTLFSEADVLGCSKSGRIPDDR